MKKLFILLTLSLLFQSCATIINGTKQSIPVSGLPAGATVTLNGQIMGLTPLALEVERKQDHTVTIEREGFETVEIALKRQLSGWFVGNILIGGLIGIVIDAATGAMYNIKPDNINVDLRKLEAGKKP